VSPSSLQPAQQPPRGRLVLSVVAAAVAALLLAGQVLRDSSLPSVAWASLRGLQLFWLAFVCVCAASGGIGALGRMRVLPESLSSRLVFGAGLGLGVVCLGVLALGAAGLLHPVVLAVGLLSLALSGGREAARAGREAWASAGSPRALFSGGSLLWGVMILFFIMNLTRAFEPPWEYDALEYHLGAPALWLKAGRITFLDRNVYSNMPLNTEMLYLLSMSLTGSTVDGAALGQLFNVVTGALCALAVRGAVRDIAGSLAGGVAGAIYYAWPGVTLYAGTAHVEIAQQFYGVLALWATIWAFVDKRGPLRMSALAGLAAGLSMGVKYPGAVFVTIPVAALCLAAGFRNGKPRVAVAAAALAGIMAVASFSPWLVRNAINTGNPLYPLLYRVFGGAHWSAWEEARWQSRHSPGATSPAEFLSAVRSWATAAEDSTQSELLFVFLPFLALTRRRGLTPVLTIAGYAGFCFLAWFLFTHRADRFLAPAVPALAALGGMGFAAVSSRAGRVAAGVALGGLLIAGPSASVRYALVERSLASALGEAPAGFFATKAPDFRLGFEAMQALNDPAKVPPDAKVLFFPEARTFWAERSVIACTPFDRSVMEEVVRNAASPEDAAAALRRLGVTHVLVNYAEIGRLLRTGDYLFDGRQRPHILDGFNWPLFQAFEQRHLERVAAFGPESQRPAIAIYRLAPPHR